MTEIDWTPSIVVLVVGVFAGLIMAKLQGGAGRSAAARAADLEDLRRQKERLLRALRDLQDLSRGDVDGERAELEMQAAEVMRRLEEVDAADKQAARKEARKKGKVATKKGEHATKKGEHATKKGEDGPEGGLSPELKGMLKGAAVVAFVALCFFLLTRSTSERTDGMGMTGGQPGMSAPRGAQEPGEAPDLSPRASARLEAARAGVAAAASSLDAQIELGFALIEAEGWMEAFAVGGAIVEQAPHNPDGLVILGVVRLKMGLPDLAAEQFRKALEADPDHLAALSYAGLVALQTGDREGARAAWSHARTRAEGADLATLDGLMQMLDQEVPPPGAAPGADHPPHDAPPPAAAGATIAGTVVLAEGTAAPEGGVLFVIAHPEGVDRGPPVASRRLLGTSFPATFTIGPGDVMMGGPFPGTVTLSARLDADGDAGTRGADDLVGSAGLVQGGAQGVEIVLAPR